MLKYISKEIHPDFAKLKLTPVEDPVFPLELVDFEKQGIITKYKIGILNVKEGQKDENQMYANGKINNAKKKKIRTLKIFILKLPSVQILMNF